MEEQVYTLFSDIQERHWWFAARRLIIEKVLQKYCKASPDSMIADVGCGTGALLPMLSRFGQVVGIDNSQAAVDLCRQRFEYAVYLDRDDTWQELEFDVMAFFDVIEHVEDDYAFLEKYLYHLKPNGLAFVTVPAYRFLWSEHDRANQHYRRYTARDLQKVMVHNHIEKCKISYFNTWLFPAIALFRFISRIKETFVSGQTDKELETNTTDFERTSAFVNQILLNIFATERFLLRYVSFPFGVSLMAIGRKKTFKPGNTPQPQIP
jgi:SAM-dependent methyltransferase